MVDYKGKIPVPRALVWTNISKFEKSDYNRLFGPVSIPNDDLYSTSVEKWETWFVASISFINGLVDEDRNDFVVDFVGVSKVNAVDGQHELGYEDEKHPELDVLQHDNYVDHSILKVNQHPTAEPLPVDDFVDDYMFVLNDEEMMPNYSLDDMKFQHEEDNLTVKERPNLSRQDGCERDKVTVPYEISEYLQMQDPPELKKAGCKTVEPDADWAMVSPHFLPCILGGSMPDYFSNGVRYPVPWRDVEKLSYKSLMEWLPFMILLVESREIGDHGGEQ
ncbi:hypothetical protein Tco_0067088 [Tanacetum coccineum]